MQPRSFLLLSALAGAAFAQSQDISAQCVAFENRINSCPVTSQILQLAAANPSFTTPSSILSSIASCECYDEEGKWQPDLDSSMRKSCTNWIKANDPSKSVGSGNELFDADDFCRKIGNVRAQMTPAPNSASATESGAEATETGEASGSGISGEASSTETGASESGMESGAMASGTVDASGTGAKNSSDATVSIRCGLALGLVFLPVVLAL